MVEQEFAWTYTDAGMLKLGYWFDESRIPYLWAYMEIEVPQADLPSNEAYAQF